jgi:DNA adenine methylase
MGHNKGYTEHEFENILKVLSGIKGKFILSSYFSELLEKYIKKHKWFSKRIEGIPVLVSSGKWKMKTEMLTESY